MGNLKSVSNALTYLGADHFISDDAIKLSQANKLILPGVGAFKDAIDLIRDKGFDQVLGQAKDLGKPILGICLGMQLMFDSSTEFGDHKGLGLIPGRIVKFDVDLKIPHMGWNKLNIQKEAPLFQGLPDEPYVYFVHSYYLETEADVISATTNYGHEVQVAAQVDNLFALQFHPEKSGDVGLAILRNFINL